MMDFLFIIETIQVFLLVFTFIKKKAYKSVIAILYWFLVNMFYMPSVYYILFKETSYKMFDDKALIIYMMIGILILLVFQLSVIISFKIQFKFCFSQVPKIVARVFSILIPTLCVIYIIRYNYGFPIINYIRNGKMIDVRPDTSGIIPHFFIVGTIMMMVVPMILFYYYEIKSWEIRKFFGFILLTIPFVYISGNQGLFVYFVIFLWIYKFNCKINFSILAFGVISILMYGAIKTTSGFESVISAIRRFLLTQGAGIINRIQLVITNYHFSGKIADEVFTIVYGYSGGSYPTFFLGDLIVLFGIPLGIFISVVVLILLVLIGKSIDINAPMHKKWAFYMIEYLLCMSGIHVEFFIRFVIICGSYFFLPIQSGQEKRLVSKYRI